jgi:NAD(P)-dependent dehydrogenase (short-subunit alcohol dehydrogenase family)
MVLAAAGSYLQLSPQVFSRKPATAGDTKLVAEYKVWETAPYAISKAALDMAVAKFHAEYVDRGVLVWGISPGIVNTNSVEECEWLFPP